MLILLIFCLTLVWSLHGKIILDNLWLVNTHRHMNWHCDTFISDKAWRYICWTWTHTHTSARTSILISIMAKKNSPPILFVIQWQERDCKSGDNFSSRLLFVHQLNPVPTLWISEYRGWGFDWSILFTFGCIMAEVGVAVLSVIRHNCSAVCWQLVTDINPFINL